MNAKEAVAAALAELEEESGRWRVTASELEDENRLLRGMREDLEAARGKISTLARERAEAEQRAQVAEFELSQTSAELANLRAENRELAAIESDVSTSSPGPDGDVGITAAPGSVSCADAAQPATPPGHPSLSRGALGVPAPPATRKEDQAEDQAEWTRQRLSDELDSRGWRLMNCVLDGRGEKGWLSPFSAQHNAGGIVQHGRTVERLLHMVSAYDREQADREPAPRVRVRKGVVGTTGGNV